ncbi:MAG: alpha/beta hydrolase-fold protein [Polyangiales bacterium]
MNNTLRRAFVFCAVLLRSRELLAECRVLPGPDGELSTWLVAGAIRTPNARPSRTVDAQLSAVLPGVDPAALAPRIESSGSVRAARWTPFASASAVFDPSRLLRATGPRTAFFGATLEARERTTVLLFTGADDGLAIFVDGREVSRRGAVRDVREDDDVHTLVLSAGRHSLVLRSYVHGGDQRVAVRIVGQDFRPTQTVRVALDGVDDATCGALAFSAAKFNVTRSVVAEGTRVDVSVSYPGGTARRSDEEARELRIDGTSSATGRGSIALDGAFAGALTVWSAVAPSVTSVRAMLASASRPFDVRVEEPVRRALAGAAQPIAALDDRNPPQWIPRGSITSTQYQLQRVTQLVADDDPDREHVIEEARTLEQLVAELRAQRDPFAQRRGPMRRAHRSAVDGTLQSYSIYVPPSYRSDRATPVVVALHGLGGTSHRMLPILFGLYNKDEDRTRADRHLPALPDTRALLVAPYAFGDSGYRGVGEHDVLAVLDDVRAAYRTDVDRTYMTGLSMGGIGAAAIPLHRPDVFAAAAPLCGYHDYFVRTDTRGHRRPWETFLMEARSNRSWAENGLHLPMYVVQGTRDRPVTNSTTFVDRYRQLNYAIEFEYPDLGHDVWSTTYAEGRIVPYFLRFSRDPAPSRVRFRTVSTRWAKSYWVELDALAQSGAWAEVDAVSSAGRVRVTTTNVRALTVRPPQRAAFDLVLDNQPAIRVEPNVAVSVEQREGRWTRATERHVQPALGPIREAFDGPMLVVYGARIAAESAMNRRVAEAWSRVPARVKTNVRVVTDDVYTPADARGRTVVLIGTPASNRVIERMQSALPIRVEGGVIRTHDRTITGATGALFVAVSPDAEDGRVVVATGTSPFGVWRSRFLPELLPDFVAYDDGVAPARGRVILGRYARVVCAGFYDANLRVPARCDDVRPASNEAGDDERASD